MCVWDWLGLRNNKNSGKNWLAQNLLVINHFVVNLVSSYSSTATKLTTETDTHQHPSPLSLFLRVQPPAWSLNQSRHLFVNNIIISLFRFLCDSLFLLDLCICCVSVSERCVIDGLTYTCLCLPSRCSPTLSWSRRRRPRPPRRLSPKSRTATTRPTTKWWATHFWCLLV